MRVNPSMSDDGSDDGLPSLASDEDEPPPLAELSDVPSDEEDEPPRGSVPSTIMIWMDGHPSHAITPLPSEIYGADDSPSPITLIAAPAHTSHVAQPVDVGASKHLAQPLILMARGVGCSFTPP